MFLFIPVALKFGQLEHLIVPVALKFWQLHSNSGSCTQILAYSNSGTQNLRTARIFSNQKFKRMINRTYRVSFKFFCQNQMFRCSSCTQIRATGTSSCSSCTQILVVALKFTQILAYSISGILKFWHIKSSHRQILAVRRSDFLCFVSSLEFHLVKRWQIELPNYESAIGAKKT